MTSTTDDDWSVAIAHVDADCFFASCELVRHPEMAGSPVCVLSSQDACVIAKTYDAKAAGIKTGMPIWEAKKLMPDANYLSADFRFYGLLSEKMFSILMRYSPDIEVYSIDEGFLNVNGTRRLWGKDYKTIAHDIRRTVYREVGIRVSVGISVTRILAKMASEYNKPNGVTIVPNSMVDLFLDRVKLSDICGIGRSRESLLKKFNIHTPLEYVNAELSTIQKLLGKAGTDLWYELQGKSVMGIDLDSHLPKSMARTASMGEVTNDKAVITSHLIRHTSRLAMTLVTKCLLTKRISIFLRFKDFTAVSVKTDFDYPTNNYFRLSHSVKAMITDIFQPDKLYRACGITAEQISKKESTQQDLFGIMRADAKQADIFLTVDRINKRYGSNTINMAGAHILPVKRKCVRFAYPVIVAS